MYENMVDVLIYLYETYMDGETQPPADQSELEDELTEAGFSPEEIDQALCWLDELASGVESSPERMPGINRSIRVYTDEECLKIDPEARGLLLSLEENGILDPVSRELVIDRVLAIDDDNVSVDEVKWVVLLVLMSRPGHEAAYSQMEEMLYREAPVYLH